MGPGRKFSQSWPLFSLHLQFLGDAANLFIPFRCISNFCLMQQRNSTTRCSNPLVAFTAFGKKLDCSEDSELNRPNSFAALVLFEECSACENLNLLHWQFFTDAAKGFFLTAI